MKNKAVDSEEKQKSSLTMVASALLSAALNSAIRNLLFGLFDLIIEMTR